MVVSSHILSPLHLSDVYVCVFFFPQIRDELKLTSISAAGLAFISSAVLNGERGTIRHERAGERWRDKRKAPENLAVCPHVYFVLTKVFLSLTFSLVWVRRS